MATDTVLEEEAKVIAGAWERMSERKITTPQFLDIQESLRSGATYKLYMAALDLAYRTNSNPKWGYLITCVKEQLRLASDAKRLKAECEARSVGDADKGGYRGDKALGLADMALCGCRSKESMEEARRGTIERMLRQGRVERKEVDILFSTHLALLNMKVGDHKITALERSQFAWDTIGRSVRGPSQKPVQRFIAEVGAERAKEVYLRERKMDYSTAAV